MATPPQINHGDKIILFDGVCNLCNNAINFIIKKDKKDTFKFASLQSDIAKELMAARGIDANAMDSIILIEVGSAYYVKSTAALEIARGLTGGYALLPNLLVLPESFRNWIYDVVAANRYNWFGKKDQCMIPTPELRSRFLE